MSITVMQSYLTALVMFETTIRYLMVVSSVRTNSVGRNIPFLFKRRKSSVTNWLSLGLGWASLDVACGSEFKVVLWSEQSHSLQHHEFYHEHACRGYLRHCNSRYYFSMMNGPPCPNIHGNDTYRQAGREIYPSNHRSTTMLLCLVFQHKVSTFITGVPIGGYVVEVFHLVSNWSMSFYWTRQTWGGGSDSYFEVRLASSMPAFRTPMIHHMRPLGKLPSTRPSRRCSRSVTPITLRLLLTPC